MDELMSQLEEMVELAKTHYKLDFCKAPLTKNVLTILGDQSSGKSSFINHLFGLQVRQTGSNAIDTQFTILETVSEKEFAELCPNYDDKISFTQEDLDVPIERSKIDKRKNIVWCELKQIQKMHRYKQFYESMLRDIFVKYNDLVCAIVINEKFIHGTSLEKKLFAVQEEKLKQRQQEKQEERSKRPPRKQPIISMDDSVSVIDFRNLEVDERAVYLEERDEVDVIEVSSRPIVRDLIIIDTPGFNDETLSDISKFKSNIDVLEFFFSQSSLALFLVSTDHMMSIGCSLHMLQLTLLDPDTKKLIIQQSKDLWKSKDKGSGIIESLLTGAYDMMDVKIKGLMNKGYQTDSSVKHQFFGAMIYEKVYFVINKIDLCKKPSTAFYEFGCSIGRKFKYLPLPVADHVLSIGVPFEQKSMDSNVSLGQLEELEMIIGTLREESQIQTRIINHINYIYDKILEKHNNSVGYVSQYWMNQHLDRAKQICKLVTKEK
jgi:GTPase SAR1 family protein